MKPMMNDDGLLECPFCGVSDVYSARDEDGYFVTCCKCEVVTGSFIVKNHAIRAWNTRNGHLYTADDYKQDAMEREYGL